MAVKEMKKQVARFGAACVVLFARATTRSQFQMASQAATSIDTNHLEDPNHARPNDSDLGEEFLPVASCLRARRDGVADARQRS